MPSVQVFLDCLLRYPWTVNILILYAILLFPGTVLAAVALLNIAMLETVLCGVTNANDTLLRCGSLINLVLKLAPTTKNFEDH